MSYSKLQAILMRPRHQAQPLQVKTIVLPMIDIRSLTVDSKAIENIHNAEYVIVTSQNAVWNAPANVIAALQAREPRVITMGASTSHALVQNKIPVYLTAPKGSQSETLLDLKALQTESVQNRSIVLLAGKGGRDLIANTLEARGAKITKIEVYEQVPIQYDMNSLIEEWQQSGLQSCFIVTSLNILHNFISQVSDEHMSWCLSQPIIVVSERVQSFASECGFKHIINAKGADSSSLTAALDSILEVCNTGVRF